MPSCIMSDLLPSWDEETIALLIGKSLFSTSSSNITSTLVIPSNSVVVEMMVTDANEEECNNDEARPSKSKASKSNNTTQAKVTFASFEEQRRVIEAYDGLAVPMTHGYHYYRFSDADACSLPKQEDDNSKLNNICAETPPLHLQLITLPTKELDRRTQKMICEEVPKTTCKDSNNKDKKQKGSNKRCRVHKHALQCYQLCRHFKNFSRPEQQVFGVPTVPPGSTDDLLQYLRTCSLWPPVERQRKGVSAGNYLTVRKQHPPEHDEIWNLCHDLIIAVVPDAVYSALAITKAFVGSPHMTFQHAIALGDFEGGMLCTEADGDGTETVAIDVRNRFGRIDGRGVHWVSGWKGERYSVVYYSTVISRRPDGTRTAECPYRVDGKYAKQR